MTDKTKPRELLIVEDDPDDIYLISRAVFDMDIPINVKKAEHGKAAMQYLFECLACSTPLPSLILMDLNLPIMNGIETISHIRHHPELKVIPILVYTTSASSHDIHAAYSAGANAYITKPLIYDEINTVITKSLNFWFKTITLPG